MHNSVEKLIYIEKAVKSKEVELNNSKKSKIIAISKTFTLEKILPLIDYGQLDFGENKVQEAVDKWGKIKLEKPNLNLHLVGRLQTNKVKFAIKLFDFIHSVDNKKLAKKIADEELKQNKKIKIFIQVNIAEEEQKSGIKKEKLYDFYVYCKELNLDVIGLMCIPPANSDPNPFFKELKYLNDKLKLKELSMGMSSDYEVALKYSATYLRIGSSIFGERIH